MTSKLFGGLWIIVGSVMDFGMIVGTVTAYFMRPLQRPSNQLVNAVEYNLEQLEELSSGELDLLRERRRADRPHAEDRGASRRGVTFDASAI